MFNWLKENHTALKGAHHLVQASLGAIELVKKLNSITFNGKEKISSMATYGKEKISSMATYGKEKISSMATYGKEKIAACVAESSKPQEKVEIHNQKDLNEEKIILVPNSKIIIEEEHRVLGQDTSKVDIIKE